MANRAATGEGASAGPRASLLAVSGDASYRTQLVDGLAQRGYRLGEADSGEAARRMLAAEPTDLVLLDSALPDADALVLLAEMRAAHDQPIVLIGRGLPQVDAVLALHLGADDAVSGACPIDELDARIWAILRRTSLGPGRVPRPTRERRDEAVATETDLHLGPLVMDVLKGRATIHGASLMLTPTQARILAALLRAPDQFVTKKNLVEQVWGQADPEAKRSVDVHISQLRQRLRQTSRGAPILLTLRLLAYQLVVADDAEDR